MGGRQQALDDMAAARVVLDQAADRILGLVEDGLNAGPGADLTPILNQLLEACVFNDLVGQRLARAMAALEARPEPRPDLGPDAGLMNGPSMRGLNQGQTDSLMSLRLPGRRADRP